MVIGAEILSEQEKKMKEKGIIIINSRLKRMRKITKTALVFLFVIYYQLHFLSLKEKYLKKKQIWFQERNFHIEKDIYLLNIAFLL